MRRKPSDIYRRHALFCNITARLLTLSVLVCGHSWSPPSAVKRKSPWRFALHVRRGGHQSENPVVRPRKGISVIITAPPSYASRLSQHLRLIGFRKEDIIYSPTVVTKLLENDSQEGQKLHQEIHGIIRRQKLYEYIAFTSRRGVDAFLAIGGQPLVEYLNNNPNVKSMALGADSTALVSAGIQASSIVIPSNGKASPQGLVEELCRLIPDKASRSNTTLLCPIPKVSQGLTEPNVVPNFLLSLREAGFERVNKVYAYETRLVGPSDIAEKVCTQFLFNSIETLEKTGQNENVVVIAISSTAEAEGLALLCRHYFRGTTNSKSGSKEAVDSRIRPLSCEEVASYQAHWNRKGKRVFVVAHGPVTARNAQAMGWTIDAVSRNYTSFAGLAEAAASCWREGLR